MGARDGEVCPGRRGKESNRGRGREIGTVENFYKWGGKSCRKKERNWRKEKKEGVRPRRRWARDSWPQTQEGAGRSIQSHEGGSGGSWCCHKSLFSPLSRSPGCLLEQGREGPGGGSGRTAAEGKERERVWGPLEELLSCI